jgi:hypothetical protein
MYKLPKLSFDLIQNVSQITVFNYRLALFNIGTINWNEELISRKKDFYFKALLQTEEIVDKN